MARWYGWDMDEGLVAEGATRKEVVDRIRHQLGCGVLERHTFGPGDYEYRFGYRGEDHAESFFVFREDRLEKIGLTENDLATRRADGWWDQPLREDQS